jgi:CHAT domain
MFSHRLAALWACQPIRSAVSLALAGHRWSAGPGTGRARFLQQRRATMRPADRAATRAGAGAAGVCARRAPRLHEQPEARCGARCVSGALWPVTAEVTAEFFGALYAQVAAGAGLLAAFRAAQLATRQRPAHRDWTAFSMLGDWRAAHSCPPAIPPGLLELYAWKRARPGCRALATRLPRRLFRSS